MKYIQTTILEQRYECAFYHLFEWNDIKEKNEGKSLLRWNFIFAPLFFLNIY